MQWGEDWWRAILLATAALLAMLILAPMTMAQDTTMVMETTLGTIVDGVCAPNPPLEGAGGPAILLPAAALLLRSGILTYAILTRR